jgi:8-oxo-dGTP pyrophosphatase MutT (NUDIX family)
MLIERVPGWLLLQTKSHYPAGVFRVPTGTIAPGESSDAALVRELLEEANLTPRSYWRLFRLCYTVDGGRNDFFSDAYVIQQPEGMLKPNDLDEQISGWREAQVSELETVADDLCCLEPPRHDWGKFRAVLHRLAAQHLHPQQESE